MILLPPFLLLAVVLGFSTAGAARCTADTSMLFFSPDLGTDTVRFYWKDDQGLPFRNFGRLNVYLAKKGEHLRFAMNGGMFRKDHSPQGLYVENGRTLVPLDTAHGEGNFYMQPNGVFCLLDSGKAAVVPTQTAAALHGIRYATQSGPMLLIEGRINPAFGRHSPNRQIRNGVCVRPDGKVVFALSKTKVTFYELADYFRRAGCREALYLDGYVSRAYFPERDWTRTDGDFAVILGVSVPAR